MPRRPRNHWFTVAAAPDLFPCRAKPSSRPFPEHLRIRFILSCPISSSEFLQLRSRSSGLSTSEPCLPKFQPSLRRPRKHPLFVKVPPLTTVRPQVFSTSRRFAPLPALRACFIPLPHPGFIRSGASPSTQPAWLVARPLPPCRCSNSFDHDDAHSRAEARCHSRRPRLRGVTPCGDPFVPVWR